jgi:hypothetical protein
VFQQKITFMLMHRQFQARRTQLSGEFVGLVNGARAPSKGDFEVVFGLGPLHLAARRIVCACLTPVEAGSRGSADFACWLLYADPWAAYRLGVARLRRRFERMVAEVCARWVPWQRVRSRASHATAAIGSNSLGCAVWSILYWWMRRPKIGDSFYDKCKQLRPKDSPTDVSGKILRRQLDESSAADSKAFMTPASFVRFDLAAHRRFLREHGRDETDSIVRGSLSHHNVLNNKQGYIDARNLQRRYRVKAQPLHRR